MNSMDFSFLHDSNYINARNRDDYYHFGVVPVPVPTWDHVLSEVDREMNIQKEYNDPNIIKHFDNYAMVIHEAHAIHPVVNEFLIQIERSYRTFKQNQLYTALGYISLSSLSETYGRHRDTMDVWCWNIIGETHWNVEGRYRSFDKVLEPGELIYVPRGMWHTTKPVKPRVNISFGSENKKYATPSGNILSYQTYEK